MKPTSTLLGSLLLVTACGPAWSQNAAQPRGKTVAVAAAASLTDTLAPTSELHRWMPSASPPELDCPKGAAQERRTTDTGWETWCARGKVKHGPARVFDRAARREARSTYEDGKLHGPASEIRLRPGLSLTQAVQGYGSSHVQLANLEELTRASAELAGWLPSATPPRLACPESTAQHDEVNAEGWKAECRRLDGSAHGPARTQSRAGQETRSVHENGRAAGATISISDGRTVIESTYEKGAQVRRLEWSGSVLLTLEVTRGESRALLRFHPTRIAAGLSRFKGDVRHGEWQSWHENGKLAEQAVYEAGKERPGAQRWDDQGRLIETRRLVEGTGTVEAIHPGRGDEKTVCERKAGKLQGSCRTTKKNGQLVDDTTYAGGVALARKTWYEGGGLRTEWKSDVQTGWSKQTNYHPEGRVEQTSECLVSVCKTVVYDDKGNATSPQSPDRTTLPTEGALRSLQDM